MKACGINLGLLLLFWFGNLQGQSFTPETVPNEKIQNNSYISDPSKILDEDTYNRRLWIHRTPLSTTCIQNYRLGYYHHR